MSYMIKEIPTELRPRERFKKYGCAALSNDELISILIRTGTKQSSVKDVSLALLQTIPFEELKNISYQTLKQIKGIGEVKAITLLSAIELGKRIYHNNKNLKKIKSGSDVYDFVKEEMTSKLQEQFMVIYLDNQNNIILKKILFIGTVNKSDVSPRDIFREAVKNNASNIILVHNHPAGSVIPSRADLYLTKKISELGSMLEIRVLDHIIIGHNNYYSIKESCGDLFETSK